jgi:SET domain-containing protein
MNPDHPQRPGPTAEPVEVRHSPVHGHGAFATRSLPRGFRIGVYAGRRYAPGVVAEQDWDNTLTYVFGLSDGSYIDGGEGGNATRHLNHSCAPNCTAVEVTQDDGKLDIVIETARRVRAGEELFLDYSLDIGEEDPLTYPCRCGSRGCRGTMAGAAAQPVET